MNFELHPQLAADTLRIGALPLCEVLLMNDARYPWLILVPRRAGVREIFELTDEDQRQLQRESSTLALHLAQEFSADKMNIAALGNVVPQLHVHHIVRYRSDAAWPAPVWGKHPAVPYTAEQRAAMETKLEKILREVAARIARSGSGI